MAEPAWVDDILRIISRAPRPPFCLAVRVEGYKGGHRVLPASACGGLPAERVWTTARTWAHPQSQRF